MPRYRFDIQDGLDERQTYEEHHTDLQAAECCAVRIAAEFVADVERVTEAGAIVVKVSDQAGSVLTTVRLACLIDRASQELHKPSYSSHANA